MPHVRVVGGDTPVTVKDLYGKFQEPDQQLTIGFPILPIRGVICEKVKEGKATEGARPIGEGAEARNTYAWPLFSCAAVIYVVPNKFYYLYHARSGSVPLDSFNLKRGTSMPLTKDQAKIKQDVLNEINQLGVLPAGKSFELNRFNYKVPDDNWLNNLMFDRRRPANITVTLQPITSTSSTWRVSFFSQDQGGQQVTWDAGAINL